MKNLKIKITLLNWKSKEVYTMNIDSLETDFYKQVYCEIKKTFLNNGLNVEWIVYLCNLSANKNLNNFSLHSYELINTNK